MNLLVVLFPECSNIILLFSKDLLWFLNGLLKWLLLFSSVRTSLLSSISLIFNSATSHDCSLSLSVVDTHLSHFPRRVISIIQIHVEVPLSFFDFLRRSYLSSMDVLIHILAHLSTSHYLHLGCPLQRSVFWPFLNLCFVHFFLVLPIPDFFSKPSIFLL